VTSAHSNLLTKWLFFDRINTTPGLMPSTYRVIARLLAHHNTETEECFPSESTIAKALGISVRQVKYCIEELEEKGWIKVTRRYNDSNQYEFRWERAGVAMKEAEKQEQERFEKIVGGTGAPIEAAKKGYPGPRHRSKLGVARGGFEICLHIACVRRQCAARRIGRARSMHPFPTARFRSRQQRRAASCNGGRCSRAPCWQEWFCSPPSRTSPPWRMAVRAAPSVRRPAGQAGPASTVAAAPAPPAATPLRRRRAA
jgi:DNA-binding Lrp family transcriptional regulator